MVPRSLRTCESLRARRTPSPRGSLSQSNGAPLPSASSSAEPLRGCPERGARRLRELGDSVPTTRCESRLASLSTTSSSRLDAIVHVSSPQFSLRVELGAGHAHDGRTVQARDRVRMSCHALFPAPRGRIRAGLPETRVREALASAMDSFAADDYARPTRPE